MHGEGQQASYSTSLSHPLWSLGSITQGERAREGGRGEREIALVSERKSMVYAPVLPKYLSRQAHLNTLGPRGHACVTDGARESKEKPAWRPGVGVSERGDQRDTYEVGSASLHRMSNPGDLDATPKWQ